MHGEHGGPRDLPPAGSIGSQPLVRGSGAKPHEAESLLDFRGPNEGTKFDNYWLQAVHSESLLEM